MPPQSLFLDARCAATNAAEISAATGTTSFEITAPTSVITYAGTVSGTGAVDFLPIFQALDEVSYSGWISVEVFDYTPGAEKLARESIDYMRRIAAEVG